MAKQNEKLIQPSGLGKTVKKQNKQTEEEIKEEQIEESLMEIYEDENGNMINVKKLDIKKKRGIFFRIFSFLLTLLIIGGAIYAVYYYFYLQRGTDATDVEFSIEGENKVIAGQEFYYILSYKNLSGVKIKNIEINATYPENFILAEATPAATDKSTWKINELGAHRSGEIKIRGKIVGKEKEKGILFAQMTYTPENFSSEFKKEASLETSVELTGLNIEVASSASVLAGEETEVNIKYSANAENYINKFYLSLEPLENVEIIPIASATITVVNNRWEINNISKDQKELNIKFKFKKKEKSNDTLIIKGQYSEDGQKYYLFYENNLNFELINNNLNLSLIINGSRADQGVELGQTLNYSIVYANKGDAEMKDIVIMAVLDSKILDWDSLDDKNKGSAEVNTISWSKEEIPALADIKKGDEGAIDFSIKAIALEKAQENPDLTSKDFQIKSFVQFSIGSSTIKNNADTQSNTIINKVNSDLKLKEQVRYFDADNIAVGSGPLPPKVGETTSFKIYWQITNNLHELSNLKVAVKLPDYVKWAGKNRATVGSLQYDQSVNTVIWDIGKLPINAFEVNGEFNISITPAEEDRNKIIVLLPGTKIDALDNETNSQISKTNPSKTTKLEDDEVANYDGRIE